MPQFLNIPARPCVPVYRKDKGVYDDLSETDLLVQAQAGDMDAFGELQARLARPMSRFAWRLIGVHDAIDDIVQDSLIALYLNLERIHPPANLRAYVFRIVRNRCYDLLRRQGRYDVTSLDGPPDESSFALNDPPADDAPPDEIVHWLLLQLEVQAAMDRLPELQRQTLILYADEGLSYQEIAAVMLCSIGTVKSRLFHAKRGLRARLRPDTLNLLDMEFTTKEVDHERRNPARTAPIDAPA
jgi:RNA polymerase sigma-70 factor (ECF subfamily)